MENERVERLLKTIEEIRLSVDEKTTAKLELDKCIRIVKRLGSFSSDCEECQKHLNEFDNQLTEILERKDEPTKDDFKEHYTMKEKITSHIQKQHKLIPDGYYMGIYMSLGISIGLLFGLLVFENIAIGLPFGMVIGMVIGMGLDKDAKKKGKTI